MIDDKSNVSVNGTVSNVNELIDLMEDGNANVVINGSVKNE